MYRTAVLTGTDSGQQAGGFAIQEWIFKAWSNADIHPVFVKALADEAAAGKKVFFVLLCLWIRGKDKTESSPKDLFRIVADRISFGDAAAIYQCFKMGKFYFIFVLNIITFWLINSKLMNGFILF